MQTACECPCIRLEALPEAPAPAQGIRNSVRERGEQKGLPGGDQGQAEAAP